MRCFHEGSAAGLLGGQEPRADVGAGGSEQQHRREAPAVGDAPGREHRYRRHRVDDLRNERECADAGRHALTARLGALRDDQVDAALGRSMRLRDGMHLLDHPGPGRASPVDQVARVAERKRDGGGPRLQCRLEGFLVQLWHDVVDHERAIGELAHAVDLRAHPVGRSEHGANAAQAAGIRDRRDELGEVAGQIAAPRIGASTSNNSQNLVWSTFRAV